ncbi:MAG: hypothetical protein H7Z37_03625 [Pyrinomonadaceae bacterium]|nr:hypothetical protein [Pyrinomonadaceae bacterium]
MVDKSQKKELDKIVKSPFSVTSFFTNWYEARYGKNADVKNLYVWAKSENKIITKFNYISQLKCKAIGFTVTYPTFEAEVLEDNQKKGFHISISYSMTQVIPNAAETELEKLEFDKAFRLENNEVIELT